MTELGTVAKDGKTGFEKVGEWLTSLGSTIGNTVEVMSFAFNGLMSFIGSGGLKKVWDYVVLSIDAFAVALPGMLSTAWTNFGIMLTNTWNTIWPGFWNFLGKILADGIAGLMKGIWWLIKKAANMLNPLNWISAGLDMLGSDDPLLGGVNTLETTEIRKEINAGTREDIQRTPLIPYEQRAKGAAELELIQQRDNLNLQESFTKAFDASEMNAYFKNKENDTAFGADMWAHVKEFGIKIKDED